MVDAGEAPPARGYASPLREEQARVTQRRILDAALRLLLERGYGATSMAAVAGEAGVSTQTVYNAFGSKVALVKRVFDVTLVGDDEPIPFADRPEVQAAIAESDPRKYLERYGELGRMLFDRLGPLMTVLLDGARGGDPELVALMETSGRERLIGATMAAERVQELGGLRPGLTIERARDLIWTLDSVEVWHLLVHERGWTADEYGAWLGTAMADAVLAPPS